MDSGKGDRPSFEEEKAGNSEMKEERSDGRGKEILAQEKPGVSELEGDPCGDRGKQVPEEEDPDKSKTKMILDQTVVKSSPSSAAHPQQDAPAETDIVTTDKEVRLHAPNEDYEADAEKETNQSEDSSSSFEEYTDYMGMEEDELPVEEDEEVEEKEEEQEEKQEKQEENMNGEWENLRERWNESVALAGDLCRALVDFMAAVSSDVHTLRRFQCFRSMRTMTYYDDFRCVRNTVINLVRYLEKIIMKTLEEQGRLTAGMGIGTPFFIMRNNKIDETLDKISDEIIGLDYAADNLPFSGLIAEKEETSLYDFAIEVCRDNLGEIQENIAVLREIETRNGTAVEIKESWKARIDAKINRMTQKLLQTRTRKSKRRRRQNPNPPAVPAPEPVQEEIPE